MFKHCHCVARNSTIQPAQKDPPRTGPKGWQWLDKTTRDNHGVGPKKLPGAAPSGPKLHRWWTPSQPRKMVSFEKCQAADGAPSMRRERTCLSFSSLREPFHNFLCRIATTDDGDLQRPFITYLHRVHSATMAPLHHVGRLKGQQLLQVQQEQQPGAPHSDASDEGEKMKKADVDGQQLEGSAVGVLTTAPLHVGRLADTHRLSP